MSEVSVQLRGYHDDELIEFKLSFEDMCELRDLLDQRTHEIMCSQSHDPWK
jgi:hypothetical protein